LKICYAFQSLQSYVLAGTSGTHANSPIYMKLKISGLQLYIWLKWKRMQ